MLTPTELGNCLQEARKRVRLSQTAVANQLGVTRQVISAYESGKRAVSAQEIQFLCNLFRIYPNDLLGFTRPSNLSFTAAVDFRMNDAKFALTERDQLEVMDFIKRVSPDREAYLARWSKSYRKYAVAAKSPFGSLQQVAEKVRQGFGQEQPPINIYLLAEQMGILVTPTHLDKAAAVVNRADETRQPPSPPWILVNSTQPVERQRYSMAHEVAHLLLHQEELVTFHPHYYRRHFDQKELEAEAFAAELLMPRGLLEESIESLKNKGTVEEGVFLLSNVYQVSFTAMGLRLYNLNLTTRTTYNHLTTVKPSSMESGVRNASGRRVFKADKFIPTLAEELGLKPTPGSFNQDAVRKMQEIAYTRYLGQETRGGTNPTALYALESPGKVYEKVALWMANKYPLNQTTTPC